LAKLTSKIRKKRIELAKVMKFLKMAQKRHFVFETSLQNLFFGL